MTLQEMENVVIEAIAAQAEATAAMAEAVIEIEKLRAENSRLVRENGKLRILCDFKSDIAQALRVQ